MQNKSPSDMLEKMLGWPSPEKILAELQRLNTNLEALQPNIHRLSTLAERMSEVQNLSAALNRIDVGNIARLINEANFTIKAFYEKLWGKLSK